MESVKLLFDGNRGTYIPRDFAEEIDHSQFTGYTQEDVEELSRIGNTDYENLGPDDTQVYWDIWDKILCSAKHTDEQGYVWELYQDQDVWMYCEELMSEEEKDNLFGSLD